jgi:hypothetical protein
MLKHPYPQTAAEMAHTKHAVAVDQLGEPIRLLSAPKDTMKNRTIAKSCVAANENTVQFRNARDTATSPN